MGICGNRIHQYRLKVKGIGLPQKTSDERDYQTALSFFIFKYFQIEKKSKISYKISISPKNVKNEVLKVHIQG